MSADPLPVELLVDSDKRRLDVATTAARPIPDCPIEELLADLRRIKAEQEEKP